MPVAVANRIKTPDFADEVIASGRADLVCTGRALICDPDFYNKARAGRADLIRVCLSCNHCVNEVSAGGSLTCVYNPLAGHEAEFDLSVKAATPREVVVVGGGMAGMEAANTAAPVVTTSGCYEARHTLGGHVVAGIRPPFKSEIGACIDYERNTLAATGVEVTLDKPVDAAFLAGCGADRIIVATGSDPIRPTLPGIDSPVVVTAEDVLLDRVPVGQHVAVIGAGSVGVETAELLSARGTQVTVIELASDMLADLDAGRPRAAGGPHPAHPDPLRVRTQRRRHSSTTTWSPTPASSARSTPSWSRSATVPTPNWRTPLPRPASRTSSSATPSARARSTTR